MKIRYKSSLQRTMIVYFLLIGFASSLVGAEFIIDVHRYEFRSQLMQNFEKLSKKEIQPEEAFGPIQKLQNKAILMVMVVLVVVIIVLTMFIKHITEPLQHMIEVAREISKGDLSRSVKIEAKNELAVLGGTLNELTSNFQELALLSEDVCATSRGFIKRVANHLDREDIEHTGVQNLREEMHQLNGRLSLVLEIVRNFKLYQIER